MTRREWMGGLAASTFASARPDVLVIEAATGRVVRTDFAVGVREPVGSLVKVFTALAFGARHGYNYPQAVCHGCWYAKGHGPLSLTKAIAFSCNSYFLELAGAVTPQDVALVTSAYRIAPPVVDTPEARIGIGRSWLETPEAIALAYLSLVKRRREPGVGAIVEGLRQSARLGTAKACGTGVLAKTGTSVCVHRPAMSGDGWAIGLFPEDLPRYAVVVRQHGVPGATAAVHLAGLSK